MMRNRRKKAKFVKDIMKMAQGPKTISMQIKKAESGQQYI